MKTIRENFLTGSKTKAHLVNNVLHHFLFRAEEDTLERRVLSLAAEQTWGKGLPPVSSQTSTQGLSGLIKGGKHKELLGSDYTRCSFSVLDETEAKPVSSL